MNSLPPSDNMACWNRFSSAKSQTALSVVAGERRYAAAQKIGLTQIPGIFVEGDHAEISLVENLLRQDLTAVEEAEALDRIMKEHSYKQEDLCRMIGKATSTISEVLSLNRLPQEIRDECRSNPAISKNILIEIAKSKQRRGMLSLYKKYKAKNLSKEQLKQHRTRATIAPVTIALAAIAAFSERLDKLDVAQLNDADKESLISALTAVKEAIDKKFLTPAAVQLEARTEPGTGSAKAKQTKKTAAQGNVSGRAN